MPVGIIQPSNQVRLTNVAYVRMRKGKKRYEIACYKNKVVEYRREIEKDPENVLQMHEVYLNASRGQLASKADLVKGFGNIPLKEIIEDILRHGELQVGTKERQAELDRMKTEVINIVASKLVDPKTKRVYTTGMIVKALDQLSAQSTQPQSQPKKEATESENAEANDNGMELPKWSGVNTSSDAKKQAQHAMKALLAHQPIPLAKARMRLRVTCPTSVLKQSVKSAPKAQGSGEPADGEAKTTGNVKDTILGLVEQVESQDTAGGEWEVVGSVEPGALNLLNALIDGHTKGRGRVEVLDMAIINEDD
ncbi:Shwachman-Bodian-diamond syndrome protein [Polyplosphaeria fusca]|uniref:Shwachman-Bodian-diamond syndrome protein n=1 Tax=Polyplosphaeria fusca TaxID=682080 RepID=A0A9P4R035_9PLEO|nr:Shwachman-Bodian-diamond syndrome protein [Polyplosphaeria fusca]